MDRISALRNVESALAAFEDGECSFEELEGRVTGILRTYVSSFEAEGVAPFRVVDGPDGARSVVVVASDAVAARERVRDLVPDVDGVLEVERVTDPDAASE